MPLSYVLIRDGLFQNKILVKYELCEKALQVLLKVMNPNCLEKWMTESELRKNTQILVMEMHLITSIGHRIGFLESKQEHNRLKFKFNLNALTMSEEQFNDALKSLDEESLSDGIMVAAQYLQHRRDEQREYKRRQRTPGESLIPEETVEKIKEIRSPIKYRKSLIDEPDTVATYHTQKAMDNGTLNQETAKDLHDSGKCGLDPLKCRICAINAGVINF